LSAGIAGEQPREVDHRQRGVVDGQGFLVVGNRRAGMV
jgi:hypothetical protein